MFVEAMPPAVLKWPPANRSAPEAARAYTSVPLIPAPSADQLVPSHLAMSLAAPPPAVRKAPPAYRLGPDTASASTALSRPEPSADQLVPSHLAMLVAPMR